MLLCKVHLVLIILCFGNNGAFTLWRCELLIVASSANSTCRPNLLCSIEDLIVLLLLFVREAKRRSPGLFSSALVEQWILTINNTLGHIRLIIRHLLRSCILSLQTWSLIGSCRALVVPSSIVVDAELWLLVDIHGPFQIVQHFLGVYASKFLRVYRFFGLEFSVAEAVVISGLIVGKQWIFVNRSMWRNYVDIHHFSWCSWFNAAKFGAHEFSLRWLLIIKLIILILTLCTILWPQ